MWSPKWMSYKISESLTVSFGVTPNKMSLCRADVAPIKSISVCKHEYINILAALLQVIEWWPPSPAPASKSYPPPTTPSPQVPDCWVTCEQVRKQRDGMPTFISLPPCLPFIQGRVGGAISYPGYLPSSPNSEDTLTDVPREVSPNSECNQGDHEG